ncbi:MAG TPA: hypothetical protein VFO42_09550 [Sphingomicrobium sp.]|nr:hypothetical protein [Sphingomicrobium sp.]
MRTKLLTAAALTIAAAAPAAAQWAPAPPQPYYGQGYNQANYGQFRSLQARIDRAQRRIEQLDRRDILSNREARRLRDLARDVRSDLFRAARDGLNYNEMRRFEARVGQLEFRIQREARDGNRYGDRRLADRDRDGRPDRWEDDRGRDHDD